MKILDAVRRFEKQYGRSITCGKQDWHYYFLGRGTPILWLTGGLRRSALGYSFLEKMAEKHTVIAPDYPATRTIDEFIEAFDVILKTEKVKRFILAGQSYGSLLAQAYLSQRPQVVETLVISSGGPADYGRTWLAADYLAIGLLRLLSDRGAKKLFLNTLRKVLPAGTGEQADWREAVEHVVMEELTRADLISHFGVAADLINKRYVCSAAFENWHGRVIVLSSTNDPTQSAGDFPRYARLFGRSVEPVDMGDMGHAALLFDPQRFIKVLEKALAG
jgi:pimeloyl-ACP methyl ester carboxylesterase